MDIMNQTQMDALNHTFDYLPVDNNLPLNYVLSIMNNLNQTSNSTSAALAQIAQIVKSLGLLQGSVAPNSVFVFYGTVAVISNAILIGSVYKSKALHTKCFILLAINAAVDFMLGAGYGATGAVRVWRYYSGVGDVHTMWTCFMEVSFNVYLQLLALGMAPALVVERLFAAFFPQHYKTLTYRQFTIPLVICCNLYAFAQFSVHLQNSYAGGNKLLYTCGVPDTLNADGTSALTVVQIGTSVLVVLLNLFLVYGIRLKKSKVKSVVIKTDTTHAVNKMYKPKDKERKVYKAIFLISLLHIICHLFGRLVIFIATSVATDDTVKAMINRWGRTLIILNAATHFFLLYGTSEQFRGATKSIFGYSEVQTSVAGPSSAATPATRARMPHVSAGDH